MEVFQVLHMNGGNGETSYANNSLLQNNVISLTKPITEEAITDLYCRKCPTNLIIADMGCSSGPNTLFAVSELIKVVEKLCQKLNHQSPEYQVFLNDLPGNDFNTIFNSLQGFKDKFRTEMGESFGPCYFNGVPGSFYGRIFPSKSLHFVHSSYSLQWLSKVPLGIENNCRAEELVEGGRVVLTFLGRRSEDPSSKECCYIWELLAMALNDMVLEGLIEEEPVDSFNIPQYTPSPSEVKLEVLKEGSFVINHLVASEANWNAYDSDLNVSESFNDGGYNVAKCMRAVAEPMLVSHFGEGIIEEVFVRYRKNLVDCMAREKTKFINVVVSMTKKV
ncbi:Salicylate O-methyltransferase [Quillaja saponaria]|uniref:Salicylate O-methyltransferase n=1 Tax=Quillaja saponaria TaxID=32244 RepID=A0AAD7L952_QUISA|nr:Salicylate O-methyltransferase [Quillaja saponaria]